MFNTGNDSVSGGFLDTSVNQSNTTQNKGAVRRTQNVVPLVIRQIQNCEEEEDFKLFGMSVQIIKLVGIIRNVEIQTTKASYTIEDFTGEIKAILWLESDADNAPNLPNVKEDTYMEIYGSLRNQDGGKIIMVLRMFPVTDCNVITNHILEFIHTRLATEAESKKLFSDISVNNPGAELAKSMSFVDYEPNAQANSGLTPIQEKILKLLSTDTSLNGMDKNVLLKKFPPNHHSQVNSALQFLSNEGHIYTTTDNDHFRVTT